MKEFIEYILKSFVNKPDEVKVEEVMEGETYFYKLTVADDDMGIVIGKEGKTINSLRSLARAKAIKDNVRIKIDLVEPDRGGESAGTTDSGTPADTNAQA
jgi:uncharacterized protein